MSRLLCTVLTVAAVSVSACGGSSDRPGETGGSGGNGASGGGGGSGGEAGSGGTGGGAGGATADAGTYDAPPVPGSVSIEMAPALVAAVICEKVYACCQPNEGIRPLTGSQMACDLFVSATLAALMSQANMAIASGRATYDPAALAACLMRYMEQSCTDARASGGISAYRSCNFVKPLVPVGGACRNHVECIDGYCPGGSDTLEGACAAKKADGEACMVAEECQGGRCAGNLCAQTTPEGLCVVPGA
jgi:hypothetical protein